MRYSKYIIVSILLSYVILMFQSCEKILIGNKGALEEDIYLNYETKTNLKLPFDEAWYISNGGRTHEDGVHHFITCGFGQRYAFDAVIKVDYKTHSGNGNQNEDYYCFGKQLNTPADGIILEMENDIEDNLPGELNENTAVGNYVLIDHLNGEYSILAHFKKGTIVVSVGDTITQGQELGKAGNSGNSTEAHLHYHLQNSPKLLNSSGLPASFKNYYTDGIYTDKGEPTKGQVVTQ